AARARALGSRTSLLGASRAGAGGDIVAMPKAPATRLLRIWERRCGGHEGGRTAAIRTRERRLDAS
ncbi:MAG: hypothetical protein ACRD3Q_03530, partial [Terriglobales bacterium]